MKRYILKRLALVVLVVFGVATITFFLSRIAPGDPARMWAGPRATAEQVEAARKELGLDRPLIIQYAAFMKKLAVGDLGTSIRTRRNVTQEIASRFAATFELVTLAIIISLVIGIPIGVLSAVRKNKSIDHISRAVSISGVALPIFWLGMILQLILHGGLGLLPLQGRISSEILVHHPIADLTGFYLLDSLITGNWPAFINNLQHIALPAITMSFASLAVVTRMSRSSMLEVLKEDFIQTSQAYGVSRRTIIYKYALKNALIRTITVVGLVYGLLLGGSVVVESIFDWPGLGSFIVLSLITKDYPAIMGTTLVFAVTYITINLIVDLIYFVVDPRIKVPGSRR